MSGSVQAVRDRQARPAGWG